MNAQKKLTLDDVTPGGNGYKKYSPKNLDQLQWSGDSLVFVRDSSIISMRPATQKESVLCTLAQLNKALEQAQVKPYKNFPSFFLPTKKASICFQLPQLLLFYDTKTASISNKIKLKNDWINKDFCPQNGCFAFTKGDELLIVNPDKQVIKVNRKAEKNVVYGQAVHRHEFGISKGAFWSPKGNYLAFYRLDESMVSDYELTDNSKTPHSTKTIKYPAVGEASHQVTIGIYSIKTGKTSYLKTGAPLDRYFTNLCWSPDEKELLVAELNRTQDTCIVQAYDIRTGEGRPLFTETVKTYVEPENPPFFIDTLRYLWQSERSGHNHIYLYNLTDSTCQPLTKGDWDVLGINGFNKETGTLIYSSTEDSPLEKNLYTLQIASGKREKLSSIGGQHECFVSESAIFVTDNFSSMEIPRNINIINVLDKKTVNLLSAPNPYADVELPEIKFGTIKGGDKNTDLQYRLTLPIDFDPTQKYPVIVYVYGGPHVQLVQNTWLGGSKGWELYMAQHGFVCFSVDGRGSVNRGQAFEEVLFRNIGKAPLDDQLQGVAFLKSLPYIDSTRMGIYGWSFGGFMSTQLMTKTPGIFKVGVAGGSVTDWRLYEVMYGERYMQTPQTNPEGYAENDLTNYAKNLEGKFMMIHCELDPVVRILNTERFLEAAKAAGKKVEFIRYQKHEHNVHGKDRVGLFEKITAFFVENL